MGYSKKFELAVNMQHPTIGTRIWWIRKLKSGGVICMVNPYIKNDQKEYLVLFRPPGKGYIPICKLDEQGIVIANFRDKTHPGPSEFNDVLLEDMRSALVIEQIHAR